MIGLRAWLMLGCLALGTLACGSVAGAERIIGQASVIDGDTISVRGQRLRLHGIDAFESRQRCGEGKGWPCGQRAAFALEEMIGGRNVECEALDIDRYKRIIGRCFVGGTDLNAAMVRAGWALAYRRYSMDYVEAEAAARSEGVGGWSGAFVEPWEWRRGNGPR